MIARVAIPYIFELRAACPILVQVEIVAVEPPSTWPGMARATLRVLRCFRGSVTVGTELLVELQCRRTGDPVPPGGLHFPWSRLSVARWAEAYLERENDMIRLPGADWFELIDAPGDTQVSKEDPRPPRRPSFWRRLFGS
jgi:hypothetical protein